MIETRMAMKIRMAMVELLAKTVAVMEYSWTSIASMMMTRTKGCVDGCRRES